MGLPISAAVILVLWLWTMLASDASWLVITGFWLIVGTGIAVWVSQHMRRHGRDLDGIARGLESALRRDAADVYDIRAQRFAEFEECEDEGACYAFDLDGTRLVFIAGQEFYPESKFPSLDFSLVYILDEADRQVDMLIDKRGPKARPAITIPSRVKQRMEVPENLKVRNGTLENLARES